MLAGVPLLLVLATAPAAEPSVQALRVSEEIRIDGRLDEPAWTTAPTASDFRQMEPREGEAATEATEVSVLYDERNLYIGVRALDSEPDEVIARILRRDALVRQSMDGRARFAGDDIVALVLDTFHDRRNAFVFATNPNGAEYDGLITDEGLSLIHI